MTTEHAYLTEYNHAATFRRINFISCPVKSSTLMINISLRGAERYFFLPDSFILCKNVSNKHFINIYAGVAKLNNYR